MKMLKIAMLFMCLTSNINLISAQVPVPSIPPVEFKAMLEKTKGILIDVRTKEEYDFTHIPNAIQIGVESEDFLTRIRTLDKSKSYFVYCGIGKRSEKAISIMQKEGFKKLYSLKGGFTDWKKDGLPVVRYNEK